MATVDDSFNALGPTEVAFETLNNISNHNERFGVGVTGWQCGVYLRDA